MIDLLIGAAEAVTAKLKAVWPGMLARAAAPSLLAALLIVWTSEMIWASAGFEANQELVLIIAALGIGALTSFVLARLFRLTDERASPGDEDHPFHLSYYDARLAGVLVCAILAVLAGAHLQGALEGLVARAFIAPGSGELETLVIALLRAGAIIGAFYLAGRLALAVPAAAEDGPFDLGLVWRASESHAATLFIVALAAPVGCAGAFIMPVLLYTGFLPLPELSNLAALETATVALREGALWAIPAIAAGFTVGWMLLAAGLAAAADASLRRTDAHAMPVAGDYA